MKQQVLVMATNQADLENLSRPYYEKGWLMAPASLRVQPTSGGLLLAVIMEKDEPVPVVPPKGVKA